MSQPISLHSIPLNLDTWAKVVTGLSAAQEGVLLRAVRAAWTAAHRGAPPATLPNDDAELARIIGERQHVETVRRFFRPREEAPDQLEWGWLVEEYRAACGRYLARKLGGVLTGAKKREEAAVRKLRQGRQASGPAAAPVPHSKAKLDAQQDAQRQAELKHPYPYSSKEPELAADAAPAMEGRASPPLTAPTDPPAPSSSEVVAWAEERPALRDALARELEAHLDDENPGWRDRSAGVAVRQRLLSARLAEAYVAERRRGSLPSPVAALTPHPSGAAHA